MLVSALMLRMTAGTLNADDCLRACCAAGACGYMVPAVANIDAVAASTPACAVLYAWLC
jgi:hypothetical protein